MALHENVEYDYKCRIKQLPQQRIAGAGNCRSKQLPEQEIAGLNKYRSRKLPEQRIV